ncbi:hypothetical protein F0562_021123 [Nyssa sinensis]|uniref:Protein CHROMATIN REMODELING 8 n=1 Tax=Nyssa sinensis TaxID=561372 RepID=A0A5J5BNV5_9ASTE|nr:hypothetical protein F0562_021123 [Nyssa sinensis]
MVGNGTWGPLYMDPIMNSLIGQDGATRTIRDFRRETIHISSCTSIKDGFSWLLGVKSANPEDIERDILAEARTNAGDSSEAGGSTEEELLERSKSNELSSTSHAELYNKLRAVEVEIDAVASSVEQVKNLARIEDNVPDSNDGREQGDTGNKQNIVQASPNDLTLQHALATDRLRSLKKTKAQLEREISNVCKDDPSRGGKHDKLILNLVKEEPRPKRKLKEVQKSSKNLKKRQKTVSFDVDDDFDAVLNAASAGFVETERDELGTMYPEEEDEIDDLASTSIARAVQSISEAVQARPTTKLLDSESLPKLEAPTRPFQRLKTPLKIRQAQDSDAEKNKDIKKRKKRPLPSKKWRKLASHEEELLKETEDAKDDLVTTSNEEDREDVGDWLWELHCQRAGGIIGDEMGLGKTIQVLSFLGALHFSNMYKPSIVICPVTLLRQWKREAQKWYPSFHVGILHDSAQDPASRNKRAKSYESDYESEDLLDSDSEGNVSSRNTKKWDSLINRVLRSESGLLITTYEQLRLLGEKLLDIKWGYAVLDEGHRIRNPNAEVTLICKQLQTVHRIIMTGAPIQNKLSELWSLFDFVFPGKLGVLPIFEAEFAVPISVGGYANASPLQVSTAYRCAVVLRDLIMPYLLRRMKADVNAHLPKKTEHVLFCSLTAVQRSVYRAFLASSDVEQIFDGNRNSLYGIDVMRKICNHPDLLEREHSCRNLDYGNPERSGKMKVVAQVLKVWKEQGHRVLLFAQTQQMLDILENFLIAGGYNYRRLDGLTPIKQRMALIDEFNGTDDVFIFILTTKVGGLGTNLTGANRVIIFDPDWNPSTDMQARERAWRIGQTRDVTVYRLITRGTIEEKIGGSTETSNIFSQISGDVNVVGAHKDVHDKQKPPKTAGPNVDDDAVDEGNNIRIEPSKRKGKEKADHTNGEVDEETNILRSLFDAQGIHSAMNHDVIMNAHDEEKIRLEEQASQVAQRAAEALRQSRMLRSQESISIPTWTGKSGAAGAPSSVRRKFGSTSGASAGKALSSAELLARIRGNQERAVGDGLEQQFGLASGSASIGRPVDAGPSRSSHNLSGVQPEVLIRQICTFMQRRGGKTSSAGIVEHFKDRIPSKDLPLFKNLLREIATLERDPDGSSWVLKPEYQQQQVVQTTHSLP